MEEPSSEQPRPYESTFDSQCRSATSELLKAARFISEDSDRRVFHRFDELRVFVLLRLQHRLAAMATELETLRRDQDSRALKGQIDVAKDNALNYLAIDIGRVLKDYGNTIVIFTSKKDPPKIIIELLSLTPHIAR
jgi:hypothetical protein